jgi:hypothetical protein
MAKLRTWLVYFSAVHLGTTEFIRNALPSPQILIMPPRVLVNVILIVHVLPLLALIAIDFYLARRSAKAASYLRVGTMGVALVLVLRQMELYFAPVQGMRQSIEDTSSLLLVLVMVSLAALVFWLTFRLRTVATTFFFYFAPVALFLTVLLPFSLSSENQRYAKWSDAEVATASPSRPPVFIVYFDELSYSALLDDSGEIDAARYPAFARLGKESLHLTNATTNYLQTWMVLPHVFDATLALSEDYEVRFYEQTHRIDAFYADQCGSTITCRGVRYITLRDHIPLSFSIAARAVYQAMPKPLESAGRSVLHPILRLIGTVPPPADPRDIHEVTREILGQYLNDISAEKAGGRVFFLHTMLPHFPFLYDREGNFHSDSIYAFNSFSAVTPDQETFDRNWPHYKTQIEYADRFLGELISRLEAEGLYDESTLIVTADHGLRTAYAERELAIELRDLTPHIPMFLRSPRLTPAKSDIDYQLVDFGPTLYDLVDFGGEDKLAYDAPPELQQGFSLFAERRPQREKVFFTNFFNVRYWRYVYDAGDGAWELAERVDGPIGERTELGSR